MTADLHGQVGGNWGPARALLPHAAEPNPAAADPHGDQAWSPAPPALLYPNVVAWVHGWLIHIYRRPVGDGRNLAWCPQWWRHPEAVYRLTALWRGFEQRRLEPGDSVSAWIRDHLDHHMRVLTDPNGPLKGCSDQRGHNSAAALRSWMTAEPPADLPTCLL